MMLFFLVIAVDAVLLTFVARKLGLGLHPDLIDSGQFLLSVVDLVVSGQLHLLRIHQDKHLFCYYFEVVLMLSMELQL